MCVAENAGDVKMNSVIVILLYESDMLIRLEMIICRFWDKILS